ncbi:ubiquinone/menaquinone biosynthesis C-methylase UbiE [Sporomusaceae bacterium BoRhaA]|nr:ubiquinone/menaquinone biosynthesis C-methylase UbiE [Pelorhabdus rhamnosifermentans]
MINGWYENWITTGGVSASMLEKAKENIDKTPYGSMIELVQGNALKLPFASNTFNAVTIGFGLRNMSNYQQVISEMARVTKPGGRVVSLDLASAVISANGQLYTRWHT